MKMIKRLLLMSILISIAFFVYCIAPTSRITPKKKLLQDDIKIKLHLEVTTGPLYYLEENKDKLWNTIKDKYPNTNPCYVQLTGNTPNYAVDDHVYLGDFTVY